MGLRSSDANEQAPRESVSHQFDDVQNAWIAGLSNAAKREAHIRALFWFVFRVAGGQNISL